MKQGALVMTNRDIDRITLIRQFLDKQITLKQAAKVLRLSERHLRRLVRRFTLIGPCGIVSEARGKPSNNQLSQAIREQAVSIIRRNFYDYGPTLAAEKLLEYHQIKISKETARQWMIDARIWKAHQKRIPRLHPSRERRPCEGELVQLDGSDHDWFEGRGPRCTLLVYIDDATSKIQKLHFCNDETTASYFKSLKQYVLQHGVPRGFYFDKHNVFKVNHPQAKSGNGLTQFGRVLQTFNIESIFAHSPQAKGRVERSNAILQDRLVKALRYHGISDIDTANSYLEEFRLEYNSKFGKIPKSSINMHRPFSNAEIKALDTIFSIHTNRVISKDMLVRYNNMIYQINEPGQVRRLRQAPVVVCESLEGKINILHQNTPLNYEVYSSNHFVGQVLNRSETNRLLDNRYNLVRRKRGASESWHPS